VRNLTLRVLEIGSGGCNAALMAQITGEAGEVTTVDIDPEVTSRASGCLAEARYTRVNVVLGDAEDGVKEHAPYDRIIVTAGVAGTARRMTGMPRLAGRAAVSLPRIGVVIVTMGTRRRSWTPCWSRSRGRAYGRPMSWSSPMQHR
jgi:protein-L-isoaspartate(D-aspartate) O-methyltransferase